jgi:hypothetical protein
VRYEQYHPHHSENARIPAFWLIYNASIAWHIPRITQSLAGIAVNPLPIFGFVWFSQSGVTNGQPKPGMTGQCTFILVTLKK